MILFRWGAVESPVLLRRLIILCRIYKICDDVLKDIIHDRIFMTSPVGKNFSAGIFIVALNVVYFFLTVSFGSEFSYVHSLYPGECQENANVILSEGLYEIERRSEFHQRPLFSFS